MRALLARYARAYTPDMPTASALRVSLYVFIQDAARLRQRFICARGSAIRQHHAATFYRDMRLRHAVLLRASAFYCR